MWAARLGGIVMAAVGAYMFLWEYPRAMRAALQFKIDHGLGILWPQYLQHELSALLWILAGVGLIASTTKTDRRAPLEAFAGLVAAAWGVLGLIEFWRLVSGATSPSHSVPWLAMKGLLPAAWLVGGIGTLLGHAWARVLVAGVATFSLVLNFGYIVRVVLEPRPHIWTAIKYQLIFGVKDLVLLWWVAADRVVRRPARA